MKVKLIKLTTPDGRTVSLTKNRIYEVLGIEADDFRILTDEDQEPYGNDPVLYETECFIVIDSHEPAFWKCKYGKEGERYCYPAEWAEPGFFEDYHDGIFEVKRKFWIGIRKYYPETWNERKNTEKFVLDNISQING